MDLIEFIQESKKKTDDEIAAITKAFPVSLTKNEVKELRPIFEQASFHWIFTGVPSSVKKEIAKVIGKSRAKSLFLFFNI
jgi:hypothetical protein